MAAYEERARTVPENRIKEYMKIFPSITNLSVEPATSAQKRFRAIYTQDGRTKSTNFGSRYGTTYIDGAGAVSRASFHARARRIKNKQGELTYKKAGTPNSFAFWLLW